MEVESPSLETSKRHLDVVVREIHYLVGHGSAGLIAGFDDLKNLSSLNVSVILNFYDSIIENRCQRNNTFKIIFGSSSFRLAGFQHWEQCPRYINGDLSPYLARWKKGKSCHILDF